MPRVELQVPYAEKDDAKKLGARWDATKKVWFVPDGVASAQFDRWLPVEPECCIRSSAYYIAETMVSCWKCGSNTHVYSFVLPPGYEFLKPIDPENAGFGVDDDYEEDDFQKWLESAESSEWVVSDEPTFVYYIEALPHSVIARIHGHTYNFRLDFSKTTKSSYWMNHCEQCGMKQGAFEMHCEPQGAFFPLYEEDAAHILLSRIDEPFHTGPCTFGGSQDHFEQMQKRKR